MPWARAPSRLLLSFPTEGGVYIKNVVFYTSKIKPLEFCNELRNNMFIGVNMLKNFFDKFSEEVVFIILLVLLLITMFFRMPDTKSIDWAAIAALFNLMLVAIAFEYENFLDYIALSVVKRFHTEKKLTIAMIFTSIFISMFMTNDVALLTLVPITILIGKKGKFNPFKIVAFETIAANLGSSLTPFGNPQNIFIFNYFKLETLRFLKITFPFVLIAIISMLIFSNFMSKEKIELRRSKYLMIKKLFQKFLQNKFLMNRC